MMMAQYIHHHLQEKTTMHHCNLIQLIFKDHRQDGHSVQHQQDGGGVQHQHQVGDGLDQDLEGAQAAG